MGFRDAHARARRFAFGSAGSAERARLRPQRARYLSSGTLHRRLASCKIRSSAPVPFDRAGEPLLHSVSLHSHRRFPMSVKRHAALGFIFVTVLLDMLAF